MNATPGPTTASAIGRMAAIVTADPPRLCPWAEIRPGSTAGCSLSVANARSTSTALAAKLYCVWLATVDTTERGPNGSSTNTANPSSRRVSAWARWLGPTPRLPGTTTTRGRGGSSGRANSLPSTVTAGQAARSLIAWW